LDDSTNNILFYEPIKANLSVMGINCVKDFNNIIDNEQEENNKTDIFGYFYKNERVYLKDYNIYKKDLRLRDLCLYRLVKGQFNNINIGNNNVFFISDNKTFNFFNELGEFIQTTISEDYIDINEDTVIKLENYNYLDLYDYNVKLPTLYEKNYYEEPHNTLKSNLNIPIVPLINF